ncbi:helix-turn-helix transcriptional regulator [Kiloniella antarctica]|uniref:Helix-turn-helix transcriptional regulator n=1 Tax=Kiloniella antarctica TaxID=1550907 RepID=A0ABW5BJV8_9PROT
MRASRLLSILMRLQKGQVTAEQLSATLEVSVRTIYRDMDHLSFAGVPVYADRGRAGGFQLLDGWTMPPTGLTGIETEALLLSGLPDQVRQLGLHAAMLSGQDKIMETLPESQREFIGKISNRVHVDPVSWFGKEEPADKLHDIADAVWNCRRLSCHYESWRGVVERTINPLGLVVKGGTWYLAGEVTRDERREVGKDVTKEIKEGQRIYRVTKFQEIKVLKETFSRPKIFDLAEFWRQSVKRYEANIYRTTAKLKLSAEGLRQIHKLGDPVAKAAELSKSGSDAEGYFNVTIPIETLDQACSDLLRLGSSCQILEPRELVERVKLALRNMCDLYR